MDNFIFVLLFFAVTICGTIDKKKSLAKLNKIYIIQNQVRFTRKEGDNRFFITLIPKVLWQQCQFRWLNNLGNFYLIVIYRMG